MALNCIVVGSGLMSHHLVKTLLELGFQVSVVGVLDSELASLSSDFNVPTQKIDVSDHSALCDVLTDKFVALSMVPATMHHLVLQACIETHTHLVTASYVAPNVKALETAAAEAGIVVINEMGLDPGIDHMSVARKTREIHNAGGRILKFLSVCGALPDVEACNNPIGYKFSWAPIGSLRSVFRPAKYLVDGELQENNGQRLMWSAKPYPFALAKEMLYYPNGNALDYVHVYGLDGVPSVMRATLRYREFIPVIKGCVLLGLLDETPLDIPEGTLAIDLLQSLVETEQPSDLDFPTLPETAGSIAKKVASKLSELETPELQECITALQTFGCFAAQPLKKASSRLEAFVQLVQPCCSYSAEERDLVIMEHTYWTEEHGQHYLHKSMLMERGHPATTSAVSRLVSLPAALAAHWLTEHQPAPGFLSPTEPQLVDAVLDRLCAEFGVRFAETKEQVDL